MSIPTLDENGRSRWKDAIKQRVRRTGCSQQELAARIARSLQAPGRPGSDLSTEMSRFVNGEAGTLRRWFREPYLLAVVGVLGMDVDGLWSLLHSAACGQADSRGNWHPAFPSISSGEVEIPALFSSGMQAADLGRELAASDFTGRVWIVGDEGTGRHTAAHQLLAVWTESFSAVNIEERPRLVLEAPSSQSGPMVVVSRHAPPAPDMKDRVMDMAPWCRKDLLAILDQLMQRGALDELHAERARNFCLNLAQGEIESLPVVLLIQWLSDISSGLVDPENLDMRGLLTRTTWARARTLAPSGTFDVIDERWIRAFWARRRVTCWGIDWSRIDSGEAVSLLHALMVEQGLVLPDVSALRALLAQYADRERKAPEREAARQDLDRRLALPSSQRLLDAFVQAGLLRKVGSTEPGAEQVEAPMPPLAGLWAVQHLAQHLEAKDCESLTVNWGWLVDPDATGFLVELGRAGVIPTVFTSVLNQAPPWARLDKGRCLLHVAAHHPQPETFPSEDLVMAWARTLLMVAAGMETPSSVKMLSNELRTISDRYRGVLPILGSDPGTELLAIAGAGWDKLVTMTPGVSTLQELAPWQVVPLTLPQVKQARDAEAEGRGPSPEAILEHAISRGHALALRLLALGAEHGQTWSSLDPAARLRHAGTFGTEAARIDVLRRLLHEIGGRPEYLAGLADAFGRVPEAHGILADLSQASSSIQERGLVVTLAERLGLKGLLEANTLLTRTLVNRLQFTGSRAAIRFSAIDLTMERRHFIRSEGDPWQPFVSRLAEIEATAEAAAIALYRLGYPEALRRRLLAEPEWELPGELIAALHGWCLLASLEDASPSDIMASEPPLEELGEFCRRYSEFATIIPARLRGFLDTASLREGDSGVETAGRALGVLDWIPMQWPQMEAWFSTLTLPLDAPIAGWIARLGGQASLLDLKAFHQEKRLRAIRVLVGLGDEEVLGRWVLEVEEGRSDPESLPFTAAIHEALAVSPGAREKAWRLAAGPLVRRILLEMCASAGPPFPRWFLSAADRALEDEETTPRWMDRVPGLLDLRIRALDRVTPPGRRASLALDLWTSGQQPQASLADAVLDWMHEEMMPFAEVVKGEEDRPRWGKALDFLGELLLGEMATDRALEVMEKWWDLALRLTLTTLVDGNSESVSASPPCVLARLARLLIRSGSSGMIRDGFLHPPAVACDDRDVLEEAADQLQVDLPEIGPFHRVPLSTLSLDRNTLLRIWLLPMVLPSLSQSAREDLVEEGGWLAAVAGPWLANSGFGLALDRLEQWMANRRDIDASAWPPVLESLSRHRPWFVTSWVKRRWEEEPSRRQALEDSLRNVVHLLGPEANPARIWLRERQLNLGRYEKARGEAPFPPMGPPGFGIS